MPDNPQRLELLVDIEQRQHGKRTVCILGQPPTPHLGKAPDALERGKRMLDLGTGLALGAVDLFVPLAQRCVSVSTFVYEVFALGFFRFERVPRTPVGAVAIQPGLVAVLVKLPNC